MSAVADWRNSEQTYTNARDLPDSHAVQHPQNGGLYEYNHYSKVEKGECEFDRVDTKDLRHARKATHLQSNILTHEDDDLREERTHAYDFQNRGPAAASNAGWDAKTATVKPVNDSYGKNRNIDTYKRRQDELSSQILE